MRRHGDVHAERQLHRGGGLSYTVTDQAPLSNALVNGLGGTSGFGENSFAAADEGQQSVSLTPIFASGINFFGTNYTRSQWITTASSISAVACPSLPAATNTPSTMIRQGRRMILILGRFSPGRRAQSPVPCGGIAPFWADVDTRGTTSVSPGGNSTGTNLAYWDVDPRTTC